MTTGTNTMQSARSITWLVLRESVLSFGANKGLEAAATLAYYGFLSLMPLLLIGMFLLGTVLRSSEAVLAGMQGVTSDLFPSFNEAILSDLLTLSQQRVWGVVSLIVLLWSMTPFAAALRSAVTRIFKSDLKLNIVKAKLFDVTAILSLLMLFVGLVAWRIFVSSRAAAMMPATAAGRWLGVVIPFAATLLLLAAVYRWFAPVKPRWTHLLAGAITSTALLSVIRPLFGLLLHYNPNYGYAFGSLKAIFFLIIWVYYTFAVILFGAEVMANAQRRDALLLRGLFTGSAAPGKGAARLVERFMRTLARDEILFREGEAGHEMFYIDAGAIELTKADRVLRRMKSGDYFGEMSMLLGAARTATATAAEDETRLVAISEDNFDTILRENPSIVRTILREMAVRLKTTSEQLK